MDVNRLYVKDVIEFLDEKIKQQREIIIISEKKDKEAIKLLNLYEKLLLKKYKELEIIIQEELKK